MSTGRRALLAGLLSAPASAQPAWSPDRPLRIVAPFPAGGSVDVQARLIAERLAPALGQSVVVDNRPGAGGALGAAEVLRAPADGHTIFIATNGIMAANPALYPNLAYDPVADFLPVILVADYPQAVVVGDWLSDRSFAGLLAGLRARPVPAAFGSSGNGSPTHLAGEMFARALGIPLTHVPYRGQGPALNDLIGGQLQLMFPSVSDVLGQLRAGRVTAVAAMSGRRIRLLPEVPSTAELGQPELVSSIWAGLYLRAGSPLAAVAWLNAEVGRILAEPAVRLRLEAAGFELRPGTPQDLAALQAADTRRLGAIIRATGATAE